MADPTTEQWIETALTGDDGVWQIGDGQTVVGSTEAVMEFLGLSPQYNEHCKGWRWHMYMQDTHKRAEAVREEARKIIAARRAIEDADQRKHERV